MQFARISVLTAMLLFGTFVDASPAGAQLIGHGGAVRALAVSEDGATAFSRSFDASAIRWSLDRGIAEQVMRLHDNGVNAVAILRDGRAVTGGRLPPADSRSLTGSNAARSRSPRLFARVCGPWEVSRSAETGIGRRHGPYR